MPKDYLNSAPPVQFSPEKPNDKLSLENQDFWTQTWNKKFLNTQSSQASQLEIALKFIQSQVGNLKEQIKGANMDISE